MRIPQVLVGRSAVTQRLMKGFGANSMGKAWALLIQLLSVPVLTVAWGTDGYGIWLMIATIPVYIGLSDFGLGTAAGIDMTSAMARNDRPAALRAFQSVWLFMTGVTVLVAIIIILIALIWGYGAAPPTDSIFTPRQIGGSIALITLASLLMIQMAILKNVFQATHKYALGTVVFDLASLIEGLVVIAIAFIGGDILTAAAGMLGIRVVALMVCLVIVSRVEPWLYPGWAMADRFTLRRLMRPSIAALALTLANSFGIQGLVLSIGWTMGPAVAAVFATTRMLTRIPLQFSGLLSRASLPELTRAQVEGNYDLARRLMRLNLFLALVSVGPCALALTMWGPEILAYLSSGEMAADRMAFALLGVAAALNALWSTLSVRLLAMNRQGSYAWFVLSLYVLCACMPLFGTPSYLTILAIVMMAEVFILMIVASRDVVQAKP